MLNRLIENGNSTKNKTVTTIALLLMMTIAVPLIALPVNAQTPSYPYLGALPNPVGVGQEVLLHIGMMDPLSSVTQGYEDLSIDITDPDGHTTTATGIKTDATGGTGYVFTPDIVGDWKLQGHFPEQRGYAASDTEILILVVQADPLPFYPTPPLPTEYWTRPIDNQLREHKDFQECLANFLQERTIP